MPRAEIGTPKYIANKMKAKGLQRLRWYCQVCEKQCRDENGFKCHTQSESHVRQMLIIGENPKKKVDEYSEQFKHDFISLLKSSHGEKKVNYNKFYQEYIADRSHIHMNATKWVTLTEFVKFLSDQGICKVEDDPGKDGGFMIAYVDNSPEALRRRQLAQKRERTEFDDAERDKKLLESQIKKAKIEISDKKKGQDQEQVKPKELERKDGEEKVKLSLNFSAKRKPMVGGSTNRPKPIKLK
ncbi:domain of Kin17 curved DNA-binding protein-domain-containing protein [Dipodascopsis uninucleata]